ncbi:transglycosylase domain-containing protein [Nitratiruptor tergarcus]|uniref:Penicillin-binding protein 1A n=1 Tax=Nitratiruptor tergarcus DSM 16512 TaxID=1069081 RepID=A0A1W1WPU9_9BACT|nr:PBP1A family penicillin-binding protein [Nitratiruptor tergarcus]SMC08327.1 penicillin-binding protein 1A [Nitratiruptor tergarcus DSM 16512]
MKIVKAFFGLLFVIFIGVIIYAVFYLGGLYNEAIPKAKQIIEYQPKLTTKIYDRNGELIANIFDGQNREYVTYEDIPARAIEALLAIEDTKFFEHHGINPDAIVRAIIKDIKARKFVEGASTITQQLVKTMVLSREKKIKRKLTEMLIAIYIETKLTKEEILERYFNQVYFGHGYYGIKTAALGYFHKTLQNLSLKEIAMLVGLPRAPSYYDPTKNYEESIRRADRVINRMYELGWIDKRMFTQAIAEQPKVYDDTLSQNRAPYVVDEILRRFGKKMPNFRSGGYKIFTTIDLSMQQIAKEELKKGYENILARGKDYNYSKLNGAMVVLRPRSGEVLALVGGVDYATSPFNRATQAKRQPGSAFKPFIYQIALNLGYSQVDKIPDVARTYEFKEGNETKIWQPKNYEKNFEGTITLKDALIHSRNLATINLVEDIGLGRMYKELQKFGFQNLPRDLSLSLGSIVLSPLELAKFYSMFPNYGVQIEPRLVYSITDAKGESIYQSTLMKKELVSPQQTFLMIDILRDVVNRGTGRRAKVPGIEVAGKTGTTNRYIDAWFCGFTPDIEVITWFGQDDNTPLKKRESGGRASAPVVGAFIERIYQLHPELKKRFDIPQGVKKMRYNGKIIYYTDISRPSHEDVEVEEQKEELLF